MSVNEKKWLVMHMHVQLKLDELRGPPNPFAHCDMKVPGQLARHSGNCQFQRILDQPRPLLELSCQEWSHQECAKKPGNSQL